MTTYNTGNPIGSTDVRDLYDNAQNLDSLVNGPLASYADRLGVPRKSWRGIEQDFAAFLAASGFELPALEYVGGSPLVVDRPTQLIFRTGFPGTLYGVKSTEPFPATLTGTWATDESRLVVRSDGDLRQDLANSTDPAKGAALVGYRETNVSEALDSKVTQVSSVSDLRNMEPLYIGQLVYVLEYTAGTGYGGGLYKSVENTYTGSDSEETLSGSRWRIVTEDNVFPIDRLGAIKDDPVTGNAAFIRAIECVREAGSGTVYVGSGEWAIADLYYEVNTSNIKFHFDLGCHITMGGVLLGWYPTAPGKGYSNVSIEGKGVIEASPGTMWHNDFVYVDGVEVRGLTFIRPVTSGHFLDLNGCANVTIDGITVLGSNVEVPNDPRLFSEFIQTSADDPGSLGWDVKRTEYAPMMGLGIGSSNVSLTNSMFIPHTDGSGVTYPPRPIGDHGLAASVSDVRVIGNTFVDVIRQDMTDREAWLEMPTADGVIIHGNTFNFTQASVAPGDIVYFISLRGVANSSGVSISNNSFRIAGTTGYFVAIYVDDPIDVAVVNNAFDCVKDFSDLIVLGRPSCRLQAIGNTVRSKGRRFIYSSTAGNEVTIQGNILSFDPPSIPSNYRHPVEILNSTGVISDNQISHPEKAVLGLGGGAYVVSGNVLKGGAVDLSIAGGVLSGNVFHTTTAPTVTIGGAAQTPSGWNFTYVPA